MDIERGVRSESGGAREVSFFLYFLLVTESERELESLEGVSVFFITETRLQNKTKRQKKLREQRRQPKNLPSQSRRLISRFGENELFSPASLVSNNTGEINCQMRAHKSRNDR